MSNRAIYDSPQIAPVEKSLMIMTQGADGKKMVESGNKKQLIERLVDPKEFDLAYLKAFMMTHIMFMDSMQLLDSIIDEFTKFSMDGSKNEPNLVIMR